MRISWLLVIVLPACGAGQAEQARVQAMEQRLVALNEAFSAQEQRIEQLRDRLALLEDRQESSQLQLAPRPLPVVRLWPSEPVDLGREVAVPQRVALEATPEAPVDAPIDERPAVTITQADLDALGGGVIEGGERRFPRQPVAPPDNAAFAGNIGVVPMEGARKPAPRLDPGPRGDAPRPEAVAAGARPDAGGDDAIAAYKKAYNLYRGGEGPKAEEALRAFVARYGTHDYADNALFWVGQIQFDESRFEAALGTFRRVVTDYPTGNKLPDALLMVGEAQKRLGREAEGRETQERVRTMYPHTEAGRRAAELLRPGSM